MFSFEVRREYTSYCRKIAKDTMLLNEISKGVPKTLVDKLRSLIDLKKADRNTIDLTEFLKRKKRITSFSENLLGSN